MGVTVFVGIDNEFFERKHIKTDNTIRCYIYYKSRMGFHQQITQQLLTMDTNTLPHSIPEDPAVLALGMTLKQMFVQGVLSRMWICSATNEVHVS
jgi:hypothetical protein